MVLTREMARGRLNLSDGSKIVYVQLGVGRINDIDSEIRLTVDALLKHEYPCRHRRKHAW